jgi:hypothetical protein
MANIVTDETKIALFQQYCALSIASLQNQMQRSRRPVPQWVLLRTFDGILEYGNNLEMADVSTMQNTLQRIVQAAALPAVAPSAPAPPAE